MTIWNIKERIMEKCKKPTPNLINSGASDDMSALVMGRGRRSGETKNQALNS